MFLDADYTVTDSHVSADSTVFLDDLLGDRVTVPAEILDAANLPARGPVRVFLHLPGVNTSVDLTREGDVLHGIEWPLEVMEGQMAAWSVAVGGKVLTLLCS